MKKPICKILRTNKNNNLKFTIKFLMTLDRSYIGYLGFFGIDFLKSVLMYILKALFASADYFLKREFLQCVLVFQFTNPEYIGSQFPPPSSLLYGKMGSITLFFFKWVY